MEKKRIHFIKMEWKHISKVEKSGVIKSDDSKVDKKTDTATRILPLLRDNHGALCIFTDQQLCFDYCLKLPLMDDTDDDNLDVGRWKRIAKAPGDGIPFNFNDVRWIAMLVKCKFGGKAESVHVEKNNKLKNQQQNKTTQFTSFLSIINQMSNFDNKDHVYYLFTDVSFNVPSKKQNFLKVETININQVRIRLGGEFAKFLENSQKIIQTLEEKDS